MIVISQRAGSFGNIGSMIILGIETSCDETAAAVLKRDKHGRVQILSNIVASSALLQSKYGGIIPEQAAREQIKSIIPVIEESLQVAGYRGQEMDAIAVTYGPGLIGSLLVGVETAKVLAKVWKKPLIPINHLIGHFYANWIARGDGERGAPLSARNEVRTSNGAATRQDPKQSTPIFPCIGLLVSGGHTDLVLFKDHGKYEYLGGTRDDAAGECFDKCARLLGLPYPGGPEISRLAKNGNPKKYDLPRPMFHSKDFDFSFSGLKTAVANLITIKKLVKSDARKNLVQLSVKQSAMTEPLSGAKQTLSERSGRASGFFSTDELPDIAASIEQTIINVLIDKTIKAAQKYNIDQIIVAGGVAANSKLVNKLQVTADSLNIKLHIPPPNLCTDNGAMIASAAFFQKPITNPFDLQADPNLALSD